MIGAMEKSAPHRSSYGPLSIIYAFFSPAVRMLFANVKIMQIQLN